MLRPIFVWTRGQWQRILTLKEAPRAISAGVAIGVVVGFTPLYSIKTLLALLLAWICRSSKLAAVVVVTLYDLLLPLEPVLLRLQYGTGRWLLSSPHQWPEPLGMNHLFLHWREWLTPSMLAEVIWPTLIGSLVMSLPIALLAYWFIWRVLVPPNGVLGGPTPSRGEGAGEGESGPRCG